MIALYYRLIIQKFDSAQDDTLKGLLREPRTNGRTQFAPTDEIKIFCFIAYGSAFYNRYDIGQSRTPVPTNKRDNPRAFGD